MSLENRIEQLERNVSGGAEYRPMHILDQNEDRTTYTVRTSPTAPIGAMLTEAEKDLLPGLKIVARRP